MFRMQIGMLCRIGVVQVNSSGFVVHSGQPTVVDAVDDEGEKSYELSIRKDYSQNVRSRCTIVVYQLFPNTN